MTSQFAVAAQRCFFAPTFAIKFLAAYFTFVANANQVLRCPFLQPVDLATNVPTGTFKIHPAYY